MSGGELQSVHVGPLETLLIKWLNLERINTWRGLGIRQETNLPHETKHATTIRKNSKPEGRTTG